jgi:hypothetical protein
MKAAFASLILALALAGPAPAQQFAEAEGGSLRFLDKLTSETGDVTLDRGQSAKFGRLVVRLDACRYPADDPTSDSEAFLTIVEETTGLGLFSGWMLASSPALSALDHPRYDVWVLSCVLPPAPAAPAEPATSEVEGE